MKWTSSFMLLALLLSACNQQRADFESIQLGKALPQKFTPTTQPTKDGALALWREHGHWPVPAVIAYKCTNILLGPDGLVTAKFYADDAMGHWVLAQSSASQWFLEVQIPTEYFVEPPGPDAEDFFRQIDDMERAGRALSDGMPAGARQFVISGKREDDAYVYCVRMPVNPKRGKDEDLKQIKPWGLSIYAAGVSDLVKWLDLSDVDTKALDAANIHFTIERDNHGLFLIASCTSKKSDKTIVDYLAQVRGQLTGYGLADCDPNVSPYYGGIFFGLFMVTGVRTCWAESMNNYWPLLRGITKDGFDITIEKYPGSQIRFRNMGNRTIRVEFKFFRIIDPFALVILAEAIGQEPHPRIVGR